MSDAGASDAVRVLRDRVRRHQEALPRPNNGRRSQFDGCGGKSVALVPDLDWNEALEEAQDVLATGLLLCCSLCALAHQFRGCGVDRHPRERSDRRDDFSGRHAAGAQADHHQ